MFGSWLEVFQAGKTKGISRWRSCCCCCCSGNCFPIPREASIIFIKSQDLIWAPDQDGASVNIKARAREGLGEEGINSHHWIVLLLGAPPFFLFFGGKLLTFNLCLTWGVGFDRAEPQILWGEHRTSTSIPLGSQQGDKTRLSLKSLGGKNPQPGEKWDGIKYQGKITHGASPEGLVHTPTLILSPQIPFSSQEYPALRGFQSSAPKAAASPSTTWIHQHTPYRDLLSAWSGSLAGFVRNSQLQNGIPTISVGENVEEQWVRKNLRGNMGKNEWGGIWERIWKVNTECCCCHMGQNQGETTCFGYWIVEN